MDMPIARTTQTRFAGRVTRGVGELRVQSSPDRSALMSRVRQKGTTPELIVRSILRRKGRVFLSNGRPLPGSPDVYDQRRKWAIFVHGCFWHRHSRCAACTTPKTNSEFWLDKFERNRSRDRRKVRNLRGLGYKVLTVWECQVTARGKRARLEDRLDRFFNSSSQR
jgi:DNA mismatch endonuclease (patch repair protein)